MIGKESEYISLREAAELSGYSSDYVGQLIRQGKLPGKQVFLNVSWVTTKEALQNYLQKDKKKGKDTRTVTAVARIQAWVQSPLGWTSLYQSALWCFMVITLVLILFLLFIVAVGIDNQLERHSLESSNYGRPL